MIYGMIGSILSCFCIYY